MQGGGGGKTDGLMRCGCKLVYLHVCLYTCCACVFEGEGGEERGRELCSPCGPFDLGKVQTRQQYMHEASVQILASGALPWAKARQAASMR